MKIIIFSFLIIVFFTSCESAIESSSNSGGPGTLGAIASTDLNCSESDVNYVLTSLTETKGFEVLQKDSSVVNWWVEAEYDFLNYTCLNINNRLFMVTTRSDDALETSIAIRAFYDRKKEEWMFATEFSSRDKSTAEKAMETLLSNLTSCQ
jgi:hypothetical protein